MPTPLYPASPSRLLAWLDCPRRYGCSTSIDPDPRRDRSEPTPPSGSRPTTHSATSGTCLSRAALPTVWPSSSAPRGSTWVSVTPSSPLRRARVSESVVDYLRRVDRGRQLLGLERSVALRTDSIAVTGRVDRLDDRDGSLVVVDYKTPCRCPPRTTPAPPLPLALYAAGAARVFRRPCVRVELHHVPTRTVAAHEHTAESLERKIAEAESIAGDLRGVDADYAERGVESPSFPPRPSPLCTWCDFAPTAPRGSGWVRRSRTGPASRRRTIPPADHRREHRGETMSDLAPPSWRQPTT